MFRWQRLPLIIALPFVLASCVAASNDHTGSRKLAVIQPATPTGSPDITAAGKSPARARGRNCALSSGLPLDRST